MNTLLDLRSESAMMPGMEPLPADACDRFGLDELAWVLAASRFARRPVKKHLHAKGLPSHAQAATDFLAQIAKHPRFAEIHERSIGVEHNMRDRARDPRLKYRGLP